MAVGVLASWSDRLLRCFLVQKVAKELGSTVMQPSVQARIASQPPSPHAQLDLATITQLFVVREGRLLRELNATMAGATKQGPAGR